MERLIWWFTGEIKKIKTFIIYHDTAKKYWGIGFMPYGAALFLQLWKVCMETCSVDIWVQSALYKGPDALVVSHACHVTFTSFVQSACSVLFGGRRKPNRDGGAEHRLDGGGVKDDEQVLGQVELLDYQCPHPLYLWLHFLNVYNNCRLISA